MGMVEKDLMDHILIQCHNGQAHQYENFPGAKPGQFIGAHAVVNRRFVDEDTGEIKGIPAGYEQSKPMPLDAAQLADLLDARFLEFEAAHREQGEALAAANKELAATKETLAKAEEDRDDARAEVAAMQEHFGAFRERFDNFDRDGKKRAQKAKLKASKSKGEINSGEGNTEANF